MKDLFSSETFVDSKMADIFISVLDGSFMISVTDSSGKILFVNELFESYSGYSLEDVIGRNHSFFNSRVHDKSMFVNLWMTISSGEVWRGVICNKSKDGGFFWCDTTIFPVINDLGEIDSYVAIRSDITQIKEAEVALEKLALEKYAKNSFDNDVLSNYYSKLQAILLGILNGRDPLCVCSIGYNGEECEAINKIGKSIYSIENLKCYNNGCDDFFIGFSGFDVDFLVRDLLGLYYLDGQSKGVVIEFFCNKSDFNGLLVDSNKLLLILVNLVGLALENTFSGHVHVNASVGYKDMDTTDLFFSVSDTGTGLSQNIQRELMLLIDGSDPVEAVFPSLSLEWYVSQRLVRAMGGALEFETKENTGTTVYFSIKAKNNRGVNL